MKLALNGQGHYTDFSGGYDLYLRRSLTDRCVDRATYCRVVREYCKLLADRLIECGIVDLPKELGTIAAVTITRKPQYRGKKFIGYGKMDWAAGHYDGVLKTFGIAYLPKHGRNANLRCLGFVANRRLFGRLKERSLSDNCVWTPLEFNDEMI